MNLFSRKSAEPAAPATRMRKSVTGAELSAALAAVLGVMADCSARQVLDQLWNHVEPDDVAIKLDASVPVSLAELDEALVEVEKFDELPAGTLGTLKRFSALLLAQEKAVRGAEVQHVTVGQLKAFETGVFDSFSWALGAMVTELNRAQPNREHALGMMRRTASTPERKKVLAGICQFKETEVPPMTQVEFLRYQASGHR